MLKLHVRRAALVAAIGSFVLASSALAQLGKSGGSSVGGAKDSSGTKGNDNFPAVAPLPAAAYAGFATLAGVIGMSVVRRRRHTQR